MQVLITCTWKTWKPRGQNWSSHGRWRAWNCRRTRQEDKHAPVENQGIAVQAQPAPEMWWGKRDRKQNNTYFTSYLSIGALRLMSMVSPKLCLKGKYFLTVLLARHKPMDLWLLARPSDRKCFRWMTINTIILTGNNFWSVQSARRFSFFKIPVTLFLNIQITWSKHCNIKALSNWYFTLVTQFQGTQIWV